MKIVLNMLNSTLKTKNGKYVMYCSCRHSEPPHVNRSLVRFGFLGHERASALLVASKDGVFVLFCSTFHALGKIYDAV